MTHLKTGCPRCRKEVAPLADAMFRPGRTSAPPVDDSVYEVPFERARANAVAWSQKLDRERQAARKWIPLLAVEAPGCRRQVSWTRGLCEVLLRKSWSLRHSDPKEMCRVADLAREAAERMDPDVYGWEETSDLRARAWGEYANACRVMDDLVRAEWAFERAFQMRKEGTGSPLLYARLAELLAALLSHQRKFPSAFKALDLAHSLYHRHGRTHDAVRVLVRRGICTGRSGDPEMGVGLLAKALDDMRAMGKERDPKLLFLTMHNVLLFRVEQGDFHGANRQLFEMRPLYALHAESVDRVKLRWVEARIASGLGEWERAERAFQQVREEFERLGQVYHSAVASLELAACWLRQDRLDDVKRIVQETLNVFRLRYVEREAVAALLLLREALEEGRAGVETLLGISSLIGQHQEEQPDDVTGSML